MRRALLSAIVLAAALVLQLTVVNRIPLPGTGPDLVLLAVVALGLCGGPVAGAVTGFCAGLGLDLAPPGSYLIGEYALAFCVIGYLCGRLRGSLNQSALLTIALAMTAAAAGEALYAVVGVVVSDPQVTWSAVRQVLPSAVVYDVAVTPFLLYAVLRAVRWADGLGRGGMGDRQADGAALLARTQAPGVALPGRPVRGGARLGGAGLLGGAGWLAGPVGSNGSRGPRGYRGGARKGAAVHVPRTPRLRQAAARPGDGWLGGGPRTGLPAAARRSPGRPGRPPRLRPGSGSPGTAAARPPRVLPRSPAAPRIAAPRRRDGTVGRVPGAGLTGPAHRGRGSGPPGSAFRHRRPSVGAASGLARSGAPSHGPKFRPDPRLRGGSSSAEMLRARLLSGSRLRGRTRKGLAARTASLRLGAGRRGDGTLGGGVLTSRRLWARSRFRAPGLGARRRAAPRFRSGPAAGGRSLLGRRSRLGAGRQVRFTPGRTSFLATLTLGRLGRRSTVWRIGSRRTGGLR